jgi:hypothetical protein
MIINNDDARLQDPILLLKIPMGTRKNYSENYGQFGHALSKRFASPGVENRSPAAVFPIKYFKYRWFYIHILYFVHSGISY